jgi:hypothetical protein
VLVLLLPFVPTPASSISVVLAACCLRVIYSPVFLPGRRRCLGAIAVGLFFYPRAKGPITVGLQHLLVLGRLLRDILIAFVGCGYIAVALCSFAAYSHLAALASLPLSVWLWWGPLLVSRLDGVHYVHWLLCQRVLGIPSVSTPAIECVGISIVFISRPS